MFSSRPLAVVVSFVALIGCSASSSSGPGSSTDGGGGGGDATLQDASGGGGDASTGNDATVPDGSTLDASGANDDSSTDDGGGGDATDASLTFVSGPAPTATDVTGKVVDTSGNPIAGATIRATYVPDGDAGVDAGGADAGGSPTTVSATDGTFTIGAPTGREVFAVTAGGYVTWQQLEPVTSMTPTLTVPLFTANAAQTVAPTGTTIAAGAATLAFPSGAYASATSVVATWIDRPHLASMSHRGWFVDAAGQPHHVLGELHVEVPSEPASPVTVTLPVPNGVTSVSYYPFDATGTLGAPIAPTSVGGGFATFAVPHFDGGVATDDAAATGGDVVSGAGSYVDPSSGQTISFGLGDSIPTGASVQQDGTIVLNFSDGSLFSLSTLTFTFTSTATTGSITTTDTGGGTGEVPHSSPGAPKVYWQIRNRAATLGVRGTVFSFTDHPCPDKARAITYVEVAQGDVLVNSTTDVPAGNEAKACEGCANPSNPTCCDVNDCATGCCTADQQCLPGTTDETCGTGGVVCAVCQSGAKTCSPSQVCAPCGSLGGACCKTGEPCQTVLDICKAPLQLACGGTTSLQCCVPSGQSPPAANAAQCCSGSTTTRATCAGGNGPVCN
jgi:hypothetical protein